MNCTVLSVYMDVCVLKGILWCMCQYCNVRSKGHPTRSALQKNLWIFTRAKVMSVS